MLTAPSGCVLNENVISILLSLRSLDNESVQGRMFMWFLSVRNQRRKTKSNVLMSM